MQSWPTKVFLAAGIKWMISTWFCNVPHSSESVFYLSLKAMISSLHDETKYPWAVFIGVSTCNRGALLPLVRIDCAGSYLPDFAITIVPATSALTP